MTPGPADPPPGLSGAWATARWVFAAVFGRTVSDTGWIGVARGGLRLRLFVRERRGGRRLFLRLRLRGGDVVAELRPEDAERLIAGLRDVRETLGGDVAQGSARTTPHARMSTTEPR